MTRHAPDHVELNERFDLGDPLDIGIGETFRAIHKAESTPATIMRVPLLEVDRVEGAIDAATAAATTDPVFARVDGYQLAANTLHLIMEPLAGRSLTALIHERSLALDRVRAIFEVLYRAVAAVHARDLVHGLICPASVLVDGTTVKLLDFGTSQLAFIGGMKHRLPFLAPECLRGGQGDPRPADGYSLAATLWSSLTGRIPRECESWNSVREFRSDVSRALDTALARSLVASPVDRPSVAEAWHELSPHFVRRRWWQR